MRRVAVAGAVGAAGRIRRAGAPVGQDHQQILDLDGPAAVDVAWAGTAPLVEDRDHVIQADHADEDEVFATFDYSIAPDETDALLTVSFDVRGDVVSVETSGD